jgi:hypothetical protein
MNIARTLARLRGRLGYANLTASVALFIALGGTAVAAVTLPRDSVGPPQIQKDAVRSPEIAKDAVRSPEISKDAVRSSEIQDKGILLNDISKSAQDALRGAQGPAGPAGTTSVLIGGDLEEFVPECDQRLGLTACPNLMSIHLPAGNWLVQAKFTVVGFFGFNNRCGLVQSDTTTIDQASELGSSGSFGDEQIALSAVVTTAPHVASTTVALRCNENPDDDLRTINGKLTALQVATVTGP